MHKMVLLQIQLFEKQNTTSTVPYVPCVVVEQSIANESDCKKKSQTIIPYYR